MWAVMFHLHASADLMASSVYNFICGRCYIFIDNCNGIVTFLSIQYSERCTHELCLCFNEMTDNDVVWVTILNFEMLFLTTRLI